MEVGKVKRVAGPLVQAVGLKASMYDLVLVGEEGLMSEVIGISGNKHIIQVYEDTGGVRPGEPQPDGGLDTHQLRGFRTALRRGGRPRRAGKVHLAQPGGPGRGAWTHAPLRV